MEINVGEDKTTEAKTQTAATPDAPDTTNTIRTVEYGPIAATADRGERIWAAAGYFTSLAAIWIVVPALALAAKGRRSRFVGFHAMQAVLFQVAMIPFLIIGTGVSTALNIWITIATSDRHGNAPLAEIAGSISQAIVFTVPAAIAVWLGVCALRGQPRALPLIGRLAKHMAKDIYRG